MKERVNCVAAAFRRRTRKRRRREAEEGEAPERGSQRGCPFPGRSCCSRPRPGSPSHRWTDSRSPVGKEKDSFICHQAIEKSE